MPFAAQLFFVVFATGATSEITWEEVQRNLSPAKTDIYAGWTYLEDITPFPEHVPRTETYTEESFAAGVRSLQRIVDYCSEKDMQLLLVTSPNCNELRPETAKKLQELVDTLGVDYMDFDAVRDEIGIDDMTDFFDQSHLNYRGAEKYSLYLAVWLSEHCGLTPAGAEDTALWERRVNRYLKLTGQTE